MKGKWLKPASKPALPAQQDGAPVVARGDFNKRIAEFKKARGLAETFQLTTFCQVRRQYFTTFFERYGPGELFKPVRKDVTDLKLSRTGSLSGGFLQVGTSELGGWECICGRGNFVKCSCGVTSCMPTEHEWSCNPGCGAAGNLTPLHSISGSKGSAAARLFKSANLPLLPKT